MFKAFFNTNSSSNWIFEGIKTEAEWWISVENIIEELSALLDFKDVWSIHSSFEHSASELALFGFSFSWAYENVKSEDIMDGKLLVINSLLEGFLVDDYLVTVDQMLLELVGKDTLEGVNLIGIANFLNDLSHFIVSVSWL